MLNLAAVDVCILKLRVRLSLIDIERCSAIIEAVCEVECTIYIVARHNTITGRFSQLRTRNQCIVTVVKVALIHNIPAVYTSVVLLHNLLDIAIHTLVEQLHILRNDSCNLIRRELIVGWAVATFLALQTELVESVECRQLLCWETITQPICRLDRHMTPKQWVTVNGYTVLLAPLDNRLGRWATPVWLLVRILALIPPILAIPLLCQESLVALLELNLTPVECYCSTIEECTKEVFVNVVVLLLAELIPVE